MAPRPTDKDISSSSHIEEQRIEAMEEMRVPMSNLKLDSDGLPLEPQPSDHKDDPLVRSFFKNVSNRRAARSNTDNCRIGQSGTNTMFCSYFAFLRLSYNVFDPSPLASIVSASSKVALKLIVLNYSWSGNASGSFCFRCQGLRSERSESQLPDNL
jgi:hypothetical protein